MPIYEWTGFDGKGRKATGVVDADSPREARVKLRRDKVLVTSTAEIKGGKRRAADTGSAKSSSFLSRLSMHLEAKLHQARGKESGNLSTARMEEVGTFTRQLSTLSKAGIPVTEALRAIIEQTENKRLGILFRDIREKISQGAPTADALEAQPEYFDELYVSMVRSGEAAGRLDEVLERLADFISEQMKVRNKVVSAMMYPAIMLLVGLIVVAVLMTAVVPKITGMLLARGQTLPLPTRILESASEFLTGWWWAILLAGIFGSLAFNLYYASDKGRLAVDSRMLKIPVFGDLLVKQALSRFSQTFATLLRSGVPVVRCLEVTKTVLGNRLLENTVADVREKILEGADIATPIRQSGVFPALIGYMIAVGEQSGELDSMMEQVGSAYQEEVEIATQRFTSVIEPVLIVFLAVLVGFIVLAILLPILQMSQSFG